MTKELPRGAIPALPTPFIENKFDIRSMLNLLDYTITNGASGVVVLGTTGESPTVTQEEQNRITRITIDMTDGRVPVIVGTGHNSLLETLHYSEQAQKAGADALLIVTPYYNKPNRRMMQKYFREIDQNVSVPVIAYDVPSRTGVTINPDTRLYLAKELSSIKGFKDATGDIDIFVRSKNLMKKNGLEDKIRLYSGNDDLNLLMAESGAHGSISVVANVMPYNVAETFSSIHKKKPKKARHSFYNTGQYGLSHLLFTEPNPVPVKYAAYLMGLIESPEVRSPLDVLRPKYQGRIKKKLEQYGLLDNELIQAMKTYTSIRKL